MSSVTETDPNRAKREVVRLRSLPPIGPDAYEMLDEIARGGMGRIVRARDRRLDREVAIKQLLDPTPSMIALFEREVRITARLQHPSIVSVLEAGVLASGDPIYVMKLVPGRTLRDVLRDSLAVRDRLGLLPITIAIADALAYAHEQGVMHRDLKPSNVLVGRFGEVVVIDWGLAHEADVAPEDEPLGEAASAMVTARAMGTPAYMSPEAARGEPVDERADVYAIGAILYETLSGEPPYRGEHGKAILAAVRAGPPEPIARRVPGTPADLAAIVDKAMAHDRDARYPSAREIALELGRFARGQLVSAHAYSIRDRVWRWVRRNRGAVSVGIAAIALVVTLVVIGFSRIVHERDAAREAAEQATLANARQALDREPANALSTLATLADESPQWSRARTIASDAIARGVPRHVTLDAPVDAIAIAASGVRVAIARDDEVEVIGLAPRRTIAKLPGRARVIALSADGGTLVTVGDGRLRAWRVDDGVSLFERPGPRSTPVLAIAGDGSVIAAAGRDTGLVAWSAAGDEITRDDQARSLEHLAITGTTIVAHGGGRLVVLPEGTQAGAIGNLIAGGDRVFAGSPDGALIATAGERGLAILDRDGKPVRVIPTRHRARSLALDAGGRVAIADGIHVWWWEGTRGDRVRIGVTPTAVAVLATSGDRILAAAEDGTVWSFRGGIANRLGAHAASARALAVTSDGTRVITTGDDRTVRAWRFDGRSELVGVLQGHGLAIAVARDGAIAASGADRAIREWRAGREVVLGHHAGRVRALAYSRDGGRLASIADDPIAKVWRAGDRARELVHAAPVTALAWRDDTTLITGTRDGVVAAWFLDTGERRVLCEHTGAVRAIAIAGERVASASDDRTICLGDGTAMTRHPGHDDLVRRVAFSPDGATLASASEDGTVRLWDPATGESRSIELGRWVADIAFTPDGDAVIAGTDDGTVWRIHDRLPHDREALQRAIAEHLEAAR